MCIKPALVFSLLVALASQAVAQEPSCENEASVAELRARLAACTAGPCRIWLGTLDTAITNFKAGTMAASTCTTTLQGISNFEKRYQRDNKMPTTPSTPGGGGGGGRAGGAFL